MWDSFILSLITFLLYYLNCEFGPFDSNAEDQYKESDADNTMSDSNYNIKSVSITVSEESESSNLKNQKCISDIHVKY